MPDETGPTYWRPASIPDLHVLRVERKARISTTYSDHYGIVAVQAGAFEGWYRGAVHMHAAGQLKLTEPGEVRRTERVLAPFTLQIASFTPAFVAQAAAALDHRGPVHFPGSSLGPDVPATARAFAVHAALARPDATPFELASLVSELLAELILTCSEQSATRRGGRWSRAVRRAREFLHDAVAEKVTLDGLAEHAGLDKFHLVRAFRAEVGLPPYEYLTHVRVARAGALLAAGASAAEAAQALGFCDESQLHRHFRRIVGITPGRFARSLAAGSGRCSQHRPRRASGVASPWGS